MERDRGWPTAVVVKRGLACSVVMSECKVRSRLARCCGLPVSGLGLGLGLRLTGGLEVKRLHHIRPVKVSFGCIVAAVG